MNKLILMTLGSALVVSLSASGESSGRLGAFEYGIKANANTSNKVTNVQDLEFVGGILITEGVKAVIRMELKDADMSDIQIEETLEEMKLSIAIDKVTGNPRVLVTNIDIGIIASAFESKASENVDVKNGLLYDLSKSDKGVVGLTMEINPELLMLVDSVRISVYETGKMDGFKVSDEKAISAEIERQIGQFRAIFSTRWKETSDEEGDWTNQLAVVWDKGDGYRVWATALHKNNDGVEGQSFGYSLGGSYDRTWGTLFAEVESIPSYANSVTVGAKIPVAKGITVGPYIRKVLGNSVKDETRVGVAVSVSLYQKASRPFIKKRK